MVGIFSLIAIGFLIAGETFWSKEMKTNNVAIVRLVFFVIAAYFCLATSAISFGTNHNISGVIYAFLTLCAVIMVFVNFINALKNR